MLIIETRAALCAVRGRLCLCLWCAVVPSVAIMVGYVTGVRGCSDFKVLSMTVLLKDGGGPAYICVLLCWVTTGVCSRV